MPGDSEYVTREDLSDAIILTVRARRVTEDSAELEAFRGALSATAVEGSRCIVVDLHAVEFLSSVVLEARRRLVEAGRTFQPPCKRRGLFAFFSDRAEALAALGRGESDPLVLCGARPGIEEVFRVC